MPLITQILKPEEFNAETLAKLQFEAEIEGLNNHDIGDDLIGLQRRLLDAQRVLDGLKSRGIIA